MLGMGVCVCAHKKMAPGDDTHEGADLKRSTADMAGYGL